MQTSIKVPETMNSVLSLSSKAKNGGRWLIYLLNEPFDKKVGGRVSDQTIYSLSNLLFFALFNAEKKRKENIILLWMHLTAQTSEYLATSCTFPKLKISD